MKLQSRPELQAEEKPLSTLLIELALKAGLPEKHKLEITHIKCDNNFMKVIIVPKLIIIDGKEVLIPREFLFPIY